MEALTAFLDSHLAAVKALFASSIWLSVALDDTNRLKSLDSLRALD